MKYGSILSLHTHTHRQGCVKVNQVIARSGLEVGVSIVTVLNFVQA